VIPSDEYGRRQLTAILSGLLLATFVASLDMTVVTAAMYRIGESLGGLAGQAWVTTAFLITSTVSIPVYGKLSDTHGRKRLFVIAITVFLAGSVLCAFASTMAMLAAFRAVAGIGAGGILAAGVFAISVVAIPLIIDRQATAAQAMLASIKVVLGNIPAMILWSALILILTVVGYAPLLIGLLITAPLLGHATWHAYRDTLR